MTFARRITALVDVEVLDWRDSDSQCQVSGSDSVHTSLLSG